MNDDEKRWRELTDEMTSHKRQIDEHNQARGHEQERSG